MSRLNPFTLAVVAAFATGCTTLVPEYEQPVAPTPTVWQSEAIAADGSGRQYDLATLANVEWEAFFTDTRLQEVIRRALEHNRDLRVAALNIERARAQYRISHAGLFPRVDVAGQQSAQRVPADLSPSGQSSISRQYSANVGVTAYELDFFGRVRSLNEAALQQFLATEYAYRTTRNALVTEVAYAWLTYGANSELLRLAQSTLETRQSSLGLTRRSFEGGVLSALDVSQSEALVARARVDVAQQTAAVNQAANALSLLTGTTVERHWLPVEIDNATAGLSNVEANISSRVLAQRPDVLAAEHVLRAANANIGAARAAFFPRIALTGALGTASGELDNLFGGGSGVWSFMPQISLPIFDSGRRQASLEVSEADRDIAVAEYEKAIQVAFREVADALAVRETLGEQMAASDQLVGAARQTLSRSDARYRAGLDNQLALLDAQRTLYGAEQEAIGLRLSEINNRVTLYKLLGGAWKVRDPQADDALEVTPVHTPASVQQAAQPEAM